MRPDLYLAEQLRQLERLVAEHPDTPESRSARRTAARVRFYLRRGLLRNAPRTRRYVLADLRAATRTLERKSHE